MNIAFFDGDSPSLRDILRVLAAKDYAVTILYPDSLAPLPAQSDGLEWARLQEYSATPEATLATAGLARSAELVIKSAGHGGYDGALTAAILDLKRVWNHVAFWDQDPAATARRLAEDPHDPLHPLIPRFDVIFTGGDAAAARSAYVRRGARHCVPVLDGLEPEAGAALLESALVGHRGRGLAKAGVRR